MSTHHAVWASNTDQGTIMEVPIRRDGTGGRIRTAVAGLSGRADNFRGLGKGNTIVATLVKPNQVVVTRAGAPPHVVLTAADWLSNSTDVAVRHHTLYVRSGAYFTQTDPNLLVAHLDR